MHTRVKVKGSEKSKPMPQKGVEQVALHYARPHEQVVLVRLYCTQLREFGKSDLKPELL